MIHRHDRVDTIYKSLSALLQLYIDGRRRTAAERRSSAIRAHSTHISFATARSPSASRRSRAAPAAALALGLHPRAWTSRDDRRVSSTRTGSCRTLTHRPQGLPRSYDATALISFLASVRGGQPAQAPQCTPTSPTTLCPMPSSTWIDPAPHRRGPQRAPAAALGARLGLFRLLHPTSTPTRRSSTVVRRPLPLRATAFSRELHFKTLASLTDDRPSPPRRVERDQPAEPARTSAPPASAQPHLHEGRPPRQTVDPQD